MIAGNNPGKIRRYPAHFLLEILLVSLMLLAAGCGGGGGSGGSDDAGRPGDAVTFSVSGLIEAPDSAEIDSDVNDPQADYAANDSPDQAQALSNPVTVGGYVNVAGSGADGRSFDAGDRSDYFSVSLTANQTITLYISQSTSADLDLFLWDASGESLIADSQGTGEFETITATADGDYIVQVYAFSSASNYALIVGRSGSAFAGSSNDLRLSDAFCSGQAIVRFAHAQPSYEKASEGWAMAETLGLRAKAGSSGREMLFSFDEPDQRKKAFQQLGLPASESIRRHLESESLETLDKQDTLWVVKALRSRPDVERADLNYTRQAYQTPNDTYYSLQWHYPLINLPQAWDISTGDGNVIVAVIDTGVLLSHPDLQGQLAAGYDFISSTAIAVDGDGIDNDPDDPGDQSPGGSSFHGTHVAGTIGALTNNALGVAGVARSTKIMPLRALGKGGGTSYDILQAVRYAAGLENDSGTVPDQPTDIINLSLGGASSSQTELDVYTQARNAGLIIIAAAGNESSATPIYPAAYDGVVSVSAVDMNSEQAAYSNSGSTIDAAAPGGDTASDVNGDGYPDGVLSSAGDDSSGTVEFVYKFFQGTSMASPHMAGVVALMKAVYPELTPETLDSLIASNSITKDIGDAGRDDVFGYGLIDAYKAVTAALGLAGGNLTIPPTLVINPTSLNFGDATDSETLTVENGGDETLVVTGFSDSADWLTIAATDVDPTGLGTYTATVERTGLSAGTYSGTMTFTSSENTVTVSVIMAVGDAAESGNAGYHYVLLLDSESLETIHQVGVGADQGAYSYTFTEVAAGNYKIFAGTDSDNNLSIGDAGEASGAYPSLDQLSTVTVNGNASELNFSTGFNINIPGLSGFNTRQITRQN